MTYSNLSQELDEPDTKRSVNSRQELSSLFVLKLDREGFGNRLRQAFGGAKNVEIAAKLEVTEPAINNYMKGRIPPAETLIDIINLTSCSFEWLLTGEGGEPTEPFAYLGEQEREVIEKLAALEEKEFEDVLQELISYALVKRASDLLSGYEHLQTKDRQTLLAIYPLLLGGDVQADTLRPPNSERR